MFARVSTYTGSPERIRESLQVARDQILPWMEAATGFAGFTALVDRAGGRVMAISLWSSEGALRASSEAAKTFGDLAAAGLRLTLESSEVYEVIDFEQ